MDRLISADGLKQSCIRIADTCKDLHTTVMDKIGNGESAESAIGAMAYFMCQETMYRFEIPNAIEAYLSEPTTSVQTKREWIPVSEGLPEPETNVLILQFYGEDAPYSNITIGHLHQENDLRKKPYWTWIAYGADMVSPKIEAYHRAAFICPGDEFVTHWMPLPAAPKEKK